MAISSCIPYPRHCKISSPVHQKENLHMMLSDIRAGFWSPLMARPTETTAAYTGSFLVKCQKVEIWYDGYLFFGAILNFSRRKKRKTMSSQEGTNQSMVILPIQLVSFLLLSFPFSRYSQTTLCRIIFLSLLLQQNMQSIIKSVDTIRYDTISPLL